MCIRDSDRTFSHPQAGDHPLDEAIGMFILGDVLVHTWDLATATGQSLSLIHISEPTRPY